ncbi:MAG: sugar ABC transporter permease [Atribacterota bacterium]|nr:sugar ABC transporter permease [Atribacterota bacterium]MDD4895669.1 sugar ABC transporter permease [Atribacterota bacterium]MDD5636666.1 sugar ABC transporter permease [Atribacterota bacterium]
MSDRYINDAQIGFGLRKASWKGYKWFWPTIILLILVSLIPWLIMGSYSFRNINYIDPSATGEYIGLDNYRTALHDSEFIDSIWLTAKIILICLPIEFLLGFLVSLCLSSQMTLKKWTLPIILIPMIISPIVVGLIGHLTLNPDFGLIGITLRNLGIIKGSILGNPKLAPFTIMAIDIWQYTPFIILIFTAGLLSLPKEPFEAAAVDGASSWQTLWNIKLPLLKPIFVIAILLRFTDLFKIFDTILIMTGGGPGSTTENSNFFAYKINFKYWNLGYGSAVVMLLYIVSFLVCLIFVKMVTSKNEAMQ